MNREQRMAETIAKATADGIEKAQRAPDLAAAKERLNNSLHALGMKVPIELAEQDEDARTGQGLDQGNRGNYPGPDRTPGQTLNDNMRRALGIEPGGR
jgi:hypothetical protein